MHCLEGAKLKNICRIVQVLPECLRLSKVPAMHCNIAKTKGQPEIQNKDLSSPAAVTLHGKTQGFVLRHPKHRPCNIIQQLQCGLQHQLANLHLSTHRTTPEHQMTSHATIPMPSATRNSKHPITTHTQADPKQLQATITLRQQPQPPHRRGTFHRRLQQSPCNISIMQPFQCASASTNSKTPYNYAHTSTPKAA